VKRLDMSDKLIPTLLVATTIAGWTWEFMHPSETTFGIIVSATLVKFLGYHAIRVWDDKQPDSPPAPAA
jgi:hypothetical protein